MTSTEIQYGEAKEVANYLYCTDLKVLLDKGYVVSALINALHRIDALEKQNEEMHKKVRETKRTADRTAYEASVRANGGIPD